MVACQIERLKKDSRELDHYIQSLKKRGKEGMVYKLKMKQDFLDQTIQELHQ